MSAFILDGEVRASPFEEASMTRLRGDVYHPSPLEYAFLKAYLAQRDRYPAQRLPVPEYRIAHDARNRLDFAFPFHKVAVELQGAIWTGGKYNRATGILNAAQKYNRLQLAGWRVFVLHDTTLDRYAAGLPEVLDIYTLKPAITAMDSPYSCLYWWLYQEQVVAPCWRLSLEVEREGSVLLMRTRWSMRVAWGQAIEEIALPGETVDFVNPSQRAAKKVHSQIEELWNVAKSISART